ncbi:MAG TPA: biotin-dependent carboxyltransferase [Bacteroidetes bacterium]|nr:biotin-dependent carboxyltransferase [Bacteroidota bacterium]
MKVRLHIEKPGLLTSVQDGGRPGYQRYGVPAGGAMDRPAMQSANWLVGNPLSAPVLEMTLAGPTLKISGACLLALTGADMSAKLDGQPLPRYRTHRVEEGGILSFGKLKQGCRACLAIGGQWQVGKWLGSCSAILWNKRPPATGGRLQKGDVIEVVANPNAPLRRLDPPAFFQNHPSTLRVLPGPEFRHFSGLFVARFFSRAFIVSPQSNRMGYRLEEAIPDYRHCEIISSGTVPGTIQVAHSGQPILLMADAQTTGGYPRLANVISADMDMAAQLKPGDQIRFRVVEMEEALLALKQKRRSLNFLDHVC